MICPQCGEQFTPLTVVQKYCSISCGNKWRRRHKDAILNPVFEFDCAYCGKHVVTDGKQDKRTNTD